MTGAKIDCSPQEMAMTEDLDQVGSVIVTGSAPPFVQTGMILHKAECEHCVGGKPDEHCIFIVSDMYEQGDGSMVATLTPPAFYVAKRTATCTELRKDWRLFRDFDSDRLYTGRWLWTEDDSVKFSLRAEVDPCG